VRLALRWLDPWISRRPFEGRSARRYAALERCAFGDLDDRLLARFAPELGRARTFLDVGAGTGRFSERVAARHPHLAILAVEPSATFTAPHAVARIPTLRGRAEHLPLASHSVDFALYLSSLRHVRDRHAALRELRRVLRRDGVAYVIELDPAADAERAHRHRTGIKSSMARLAFDPLLLRSGPSAPRFAAAAHRAGFEWAHWEADPSQPFFVMRLG
jgi:ubiquinone/menaquinone biosynthesis C-methylase UbiE